MLETLLLHILGEKPDTRLSQTLPMTFSLIFQQRLLASAMISLLVFSCQLGNGLEEPYQTGTAVNDPTEIVAKALICFDNKNIYTNCEEAYRLTESGNVNVTHTETDTYCKGPCLTETHLLLTCIETILINFEFYNKATIQDVRDTIDEGCGHGSQRGNFNVTEHMQSKANSNGNKAAGTKVILLVMTALGLFLLL